jgi:hypothetical protein
MTAVIAIFSVLVLVGCLHMQLARNPAGAISSLDPLTGSPVGEHDAQPRTLEAVARANSTNDPASQLKLRLTKTAEAQQ